MKSHKYAFAFPIGLILTLMLFTTACQTVVAPIVETPAPTQYNQTTPLYTALAFLELLDNANYSELGSLVHPTEGIRFSPYAYVDVQNHQWSDAQNLPQLLSGDQPLNWGHYDGTGEPIQLAPKDYFKRFVYDHPYLEPHKISFNKMVSSGNTLVNIEEIYPGSTFIEFHFTGFDAQYEGMDWRSLILVLKQYGDHWYIIGVVHSEWTI